MVLPDRGSGAGEMGVSPGTPLMRGMLPRLGEGGGGRFTGLELRALRPPRPFLVAVVVVLEVVVVWAEGGGTLMENYICRICQS